MAEQTTDLATRTFEDERRSCLGGTDVAAILGMHPYKTAFEVWLQKTGQAESFEPNDAMDMGTGLEPYIAAKYEKQTGRKLTKGTFIRDPEVPYFGGHLDYVDEQDQAVVEVKLVGARSLHRWSDPGPDQRMPEEYYCQVLWYMLIGGYDHGYLVAQKEFKRELDIYRIEWDAEFIGNASATCQGWWDLHILRGVEPEPGKGKATGSYLAKKYPSARGELVSADTAVQEFMREYRILEDAADRAKEDLEAYQNRLKNAIGNNLGFKAPGFTAKWYDVKDSTTLVVDWRKFLKDRFAYQPTEEELKAYTQEVLVRKGSRRLDVRWSK